MKKESFILSLLLIVWAVGCTPFTDKSMRRDTQVLQGEQSQASDETRDIDEADLPRLDGPTRQVIQSYGPTIKNYARKYGFDWRLVLAVMRAESNFLDSAESHRGAYGLMQIMPTTQEEVARVLNIEDIAAPHNNIRAGLFYLSKLHRMFDEGDENDRIRLALAAYNAGPGRVMDAQDVARYLKADYTSWTAVKDALPLLSKRYYTLHSNIWPDQRPRSGVFGGYRETVTYVDKIMNYYDQYRLVLN